MNHIKDTVIHKKHMMDSALKMADKLIQNGEEELAIELLKRSIYHDNSKIGKDEIILLSSITNKKALMDPNINLNEKEKESIEKHWEKNRHHPEHFKDVKEMEEIDIIEMVCDWHARSVQHETDMIDFVVIRQKNRFHFPEDMFKKIIYYCNLILN